MLQIKFSWKVSITCFILAVLMVRASFWQWDRHQQKLEQIKVLETRLAIKPVLLNQLINLERSELIYRQVIIKGQYDFSKEILLKNRKYQKEPGKHILTPLKLKNSNQYILIDRGFVPLKLANDQKSYQTKKYVEIIALLKAADPRTFFLQPKEDQVPSGAIRKNWLRVDIPEIQKQLEIPLLDFYAEQVEKYQIITAQDLIKSNSDKAQILILPGTGNRVQSGEIANKQSFPIPSPDKLLSPGRHLGYVYEWAFMAVLTLLIGLAIQLKRH